jgi:uncharacterized protein (TIGR02145 family)
MLRLAATGLLVLGLCPACVEIPAPPPAPPPIGSATDADGNVYPTVVIGHQEWMATNLKTTKYNDGTPIANVTSAAAWNNRSPSYSWYDNDIANKDLYGALYNWHTIYYEDQQDKICPPSFSLPSSEVWQALVDTLGGSPVAGGALKEAGTSHWEAPNAGATNQSAFTALPAGYRDSDGTFKAKGQFTFGWCSDRDYLAFVSSYWGLKDADATSLGGKSPWEDGYSIRCMRSVTPN